MRTLAWRSCTHCSGTGGEGSGIACACVWETIFRICYARYRRALAHPPNRVQLPRFEVVDFEIVARRALQPPEWKSFHRHFILGDPRQAVAPEATLKVAQALFDHNVYVRRPR